MADLSQASARADRDGCSQSQSQSQRIDEEPVFRAEISSAATLVGTLRGILAKGGDSVSATHADGYSTVVTADSRGLKFTYTDASKSMQACASIQEDLFDVWSLSPHADQVRFRLRLSLLLQCLSCFGQNALEKTNLKMAYYPNEECFSFQLLESDVVTECKITTLDDDDADPTEDFLGYFEASEFQNRIIIASDRLRDAFHEIAELPGASTAHVLMSPARPFFRVSTMGEHGSCQIDFPDCSETFTQFRCESTVQCSYRMSFIQHACRALQFSHRTFIRMNSDGLLSMQHMVKFGDSKTYVDFYIVSDADPGGDEDEDEDPY